MGLGIVHPKVVPLSVGVFNLRLANLLHLLQKSAI
jgi:hypothetical protein